MGAQLVMAGDDWLSDNDRKRQARAEAARKKAALKCAKKLEEAADALREFLAACNDCNDESGNHKTDIADGRIRLIRDCMEYSGYLESVYSKESR